MRPKEGKQYLLENKIHAVLSVANSRATLNVEALGFPRCREVKMGVQLYGHLYCPR